MSASAVGKLLLGILLIAVGAFVIIPSNLLPVKMAGIPAGIAWEEFKTVVIGAVPPLLILLGLLIAWIEIEEIKIERAEKELEVREREEKKIKTKRRR